VPADARALWLPDSDYANVQNIDFSKIDPTVIETMWENQVLGGS
jgi:hypothetical protein